MIEIFVDPVEPFQTSTIELDGTEYQLQVRYSQREDRYYFSLYTIDDVPIVVGVKIVVDFPLIRSAPENGPPGTLFAVSNERADDSPPGFGELGVRESGARVQFVYLTQAESS